MGHICPRREHSLLHFPPSGPMYRENTDPGYIPPGKRVQMTYWTKRSIRKKLHFTDERHDLVTAIRKYGVFADGPALPFRDTGFWARNGVSLQGKTSVSQNLLAIQTFGRERVCRGMENSSIAQWAKTCSRYRFFSRKGCIAAWESLCFRKTGSRYRLLDGKRCVAAWGNSSMGENMFAIQVF